MVLFFLLGAVLVVLKATGLAAISWWIALAPFAVPFIFFGILALLGAGLLGSVFGAAALSDYRREKRNRRHLHSLGSLSQRDLGNRWAETGKRQHVN